ncbi:hypothetical protein [Streptomyces sp. NPDC012616]
MLEPQSGVVLVGGAPVRSPAGTLWRMRTHCQGRAC